MNESLSSCRSVRHVRALTIAAVGILAFVGMFGFANAYLTPLSDQALSLVMVSFNSWCGYGWPSAWLTVQRGYDQHIVAVSISSWLHCFESVAACGATATVLAAVCSLFFPTPKSNDRNA